MLYTITHALTMRYFVIMIKENHTAKKIARNDEAT